MSVIHGLLMEGYTLPQIAKELDMRPERLAFEYRPVKKQFKYFDYVQAPDKVNVYEGYCSFTFDGVYTWDKLSKSEIEAYYNYQQKNHAYYV